MLNENGLGFAGIESLKVAARCLVQPSQKIRIRIRGWLGTRGTVGLL